VEPVLNTSNNASARADLSQAQEANADDTQIVSSVEEEQNSTDYSGHALNIFSLHDADLGEVETLTSARPTNGSYTKREQTDEDDYTAQIRNVLNKWRERFNLPSSLIRFMEILTPFASHDNITRNLALANEVGEAVAPVLPDRIRKPFWLTAWGTTLGYFFGRSFIVGVKEEKVTASLKTMAHDLVAGAAIPVAVIRGLYKIIGDKLNFLPNLVKDIALPLITLKAAKVTIRTVDPKVENAVEKLAAKIPEGFGRGLNDTVGRIMSQVASFIGERFNKSPMPIAA